MIDVPAMTAAEQIGARINAVPDESVRGVLWAAWVLAVHAAPAPPGTRYLLFTRRIVPILNRLSAVDLRPDSFLPRLPRLAHTSEVEPICAALRHLTFGAEADALAALEGAA